MPSPKEIEEKYERMINAWRTLAPDKSFGGMTLAQFETACERRRIVTETVDANIAALPAGTQLEAETRRDLGRVPRECGFCGEHVWVSSDD